MQPSRRSVLLAGAVGLTAACHTTRRSPAVDPDQAAREQALATELALLSACGAVLSAHPADAARLRPLLADHAVHVAALGGRAPTPPPATARSLGELKALEQAAATSHGQAAVTATRAFAPLLASLAAASACAADLL